MPPQSNPSDAIKGKIVIIGEYSVGKTCLSHRFINRSYSGRMEPTIGAAFQVRTLPVNTAVAMQSLPVTAAVINQLGGGGGAGGGTAAGGGGAGAYAQPAPSSLNDAHNGGAMLSSSSHGGESGGAASSQSVAHVKLELWDTAGSERYRSLMPMYFRDASAAVICYDIGNSASFERVALWLNDFRKHNEGCSAGGGSGGGGGGAASVGGGAEIVEAVLCGTKCDISSEKREVTVEEAQAFADQHGMAFFETSAKRDINVQELFFSVAHSIYRNKMKARQNSGGAASASGGNTVGISGSRGGVGGKVDLSGEEKKGNNSKGCC